MATTTKRQRAIKALAKYIWTLKGKCDSIANINKQLIEQYCRFAVMADETSVNLERDMDDMNGAELANKLDLYKELNKITLSLYKTLKFEQIKDELADYGNPRACGGHSRHSR